MFRHAHKDCAETRTGQKNNEKMRFWTVCTCCNENMLQSRWDKVRADMRKVREKICGRLREWFPMFFFSEQFLYTKYTFHNSSCNVCATWQGKCRKRKKSWQKVMKLAWSALTPLPVIQDDWERWRRRPLMASPRGFWYCWRVKALLPVWACQMSGASPTRKSSEPSRAWRHWVHLTST